MRQLLEEQLLKRGEKVGVYGHTHQNPVVGMAGYQLKNPCQL